MSPPVTSGTRSEAPATAGIAWGATVSGVRLRARVIGCLLGDPGDPRRGARACRVARRDRPGPHPGHPTAVGGLPASKPGLHAGTHDLKQKVTDRTLLSQPPPHILRCRSLCLSARADENAPPGRPAVAFSCGLAAAKEGARGEVSDGAD